ncbi:MAG: hypothetical protein ACYC1M_14280 [Armatimonadota bacterium]
MAQQQNNQLPPNEVLRLDNLDYSLRSKADDFLTNPDSAQSSSRQDINL